MPAPITRAAGCCVTPTKNARALIHWANMSQPKAGVRAPVNGRLRTCSLFGCEKKLKHHNCVSETPLRRWYSLAHSSLLRSLQPLNQPRDFKGLLSLLLGISRAQSKLAVGREVTNDRSSEGPSQGGRACLRLCLKRAYHFV
jgi:hypothetical protein